MVYASMYGVLINLTVDRVKIIRVSPFDAHPYVEIAIELPVDGMIMTMMMISCRFDFRRDVVSEPL